MNESLIGRALIYFSCCEDFRIENREEDLVSVLTANGHDFILSHVKTLEQGIIDAWIESMARDEMKRIQEDERSTPPDNQ
jgi:hypothetical protein